MMALVALFACSGVGLLALGGEEDAAAVFDPVEVTFEDTVEGARPRQGAVALENVGGMALDLVDAWIESESDGVFTFAFEPPLPHTLPAGAEFPFSLRFGPLDAIAYDALLVVDVEGVGEVSAPLGGAGCTAQGASNSCAR